MYSSSPYGAPPALPTRRSSDLDPVVAIFRAARGDATNETPQAVEAQRRWSGRVLISRYRDDLVADVGDGGGDGDRKSTRLNSSHLVISYAVFCLKKNRLMYKVM